MGIVRTETLNPLLVTPPSSNTKTGGYIYNARVAEILARDGSRIQCFVPLDSIDAWLRREADRQDSLGGPRVFVLDSLYIHAARRLRSARADDRVARQRWLLLAHLLPSQEQDGEDEARAERIALPLFDGAIAPSRYMRELLRRRGLPAENLYACPPGTDLPTIASTATAASNATVRRSKPLQILTVANWIPRKNLEAVLEALEHLQEYAWQWRIVGHAAAESRYADRLRQRIAASPVAERVTPLGTLDSAELHAVWRESDVFVLATRFESYGMVFAEALSYGVPVVAPELGPIPEIVTDGVSGILYDPARQDALTSALWSLMHDPVRRRNLAGGAAAQAQRLPSWEDTAACFLAACGE